MKKTVLALLALLSVHCAPVEDEELEGISAALSGVGASLADGVRTTLATVHGAENLLFTSTGRLLVTGDKGLYELIKKADGSYDRPVLMPEQTSPSCSFSGIIETRGTIYVNCRGVTQSFLFASPVAPTLSFRSIYTLSGTGFANGLAADAGGRLYVATSFQNQILRLTPGADPLTIAQRELYQNNAGAFVNGLAHYDGSIYWSDAAAIKRNTVDRQFATFKQVVAELGYFDDLRVDADGILAADAASNVLRAYTLSGAKAGQTKQLFSGPSSVARALGRAGFSLGAIIVTERGGNRVSLFEPR